MDCVLVLNDFSNKSCKNDTQVFRSNKYIKTSFLRGRKKILPFIFLFMYVAPNTITYKYMSV